MPPRQPVLAGTGPRGYESLLNPGEGHPRGAEPTLAQDSPPEMAHGDRGAGLEATPHQVSPGLGKAMP